MSSKRQAKGDSWRRQVELSDKYVAENDLILDRTLKLSDIGISAWTGNNISKGALGRFLKIVQAGEIACGSYLLVESLDRLSRQHVRYAISPFVELINSGVIVVTLADRQVYSDVTLDDNWTQLMASLAIMSRAHEESTQKSKRVRQAHANRRKLAAEGIGRFSGQMFGWIDQIEVGHKKYEHRLNAHAEAVRKIYEWTDAGIGQSVITRRLNQANTPTFRGNGIWQQGSVC
jgi:DNA invertase Pin-like site-specific DNA recombinase